MVFVGVETMNPTQKIRFLSFMLLQIKKSWARKLGVYKKKVPISSHRKRQKQKTNFCPNLGLARGCTTSSKLAKGGRKDPTVAIWRDNHDLA